MLNSLSLAAAIVIGASLHVAPAFAQTATRGMALGDAVQVKATVEAFETLKVGDEVELIYTEALAIKIDSAN